MPFKDTVKSYNEFTGEGNGFSFYPPEAHDMMFTIRRAISFFADKTVWNKLVKNVMKREFSWDGSAPKYAELYNSLK